MKINTNTSNQVQVKPNIKASSSDGKEIMNKDSTPKKAKDLFQLLAEKDWDTITSLVKTTKIDINARDKNDENALDLAVKSNDTVAIRRLLDLGVDASAKSTFEVTALHRAAVRGYEEAAALLLEHGADANIRSISGETPLHVAAMKGRLEVLQLLEKHGGDVNAADKSGVTVLHSAALGITARIARWEMIEWLLAKGADGLAETKRGHPVKYYFDQADLSYGDLYEALLKSSTKSNKTTGEK